MKLTNLRLVILCSQLFYGKPEPVWVINNRRRSMGGSMGGVVTDPYYPSTGMTSGSYPGQGYDSGYGYNTRGTSLVPVINFSISPTNHC